MQFELTEPALADELLTIHFQDNTIDEILELIATLSEIEYKKVGYSVRFTQKKRK